MHKQRVQEGTSLVQSLEKVLGVGGKLKPDLPARNLL